MIYRITKAKIPHNTSALDKIEIKVFEYDKEYLYDKAFPDTHWWLVEHEGTPVGFAGLRFPISESKDAAWLTRSGVIKKHRGHGLQKRLLRARETWARKAGATEMWTYTASDNTPSNNSLISAGYKLWVPSRWEIGGEGWLYWRKAL
jgi:GNAT superfamily N-acetyltransferase